MTEWVLVPREPTEAMKEEAYQAFRNSSWHELCVMQIDIYVGNGAYGDIWEAMLSAAPANVDGGEDAADQRREVEDLTEFLDQAGAPATDGEHDGGEPRLSLLGRVEALLAKVNPDFDIQHVDGHGPLTRTQRAAISSPQPVSGEGE